VASPRRASTIRGLRRMCVLAAVVASVAGCVGMPSNGPVGQFSASPQGTAPDGNIIGVVPSGPQPGEDPSQIVQGFLTASASYPTYSVAQQYLLSSAVKGWNPGFAVTVFSQLNVPDWVLASKAGRNGAPQALVDVSGPVQASFNGSGQYLSAQSQDQSQGPWDFNLVKVNGQWRITNPPSYRMLPSSAFPLFYKAQNLYFFDPPQDQVLVPDSVFVPLGATVSQLLGNLVGALTQDPKTPWLEGATDTELPPGTKVQQPVTTNGSVVTVNLTGDVAKASPKQLQLFSAQLVWTLTGSSPTGSSSIQSVVLELNGTPWTPPPSPCTGIRSPDPQQTQAAYACYDPYPSSPASFYYVDRGQLWARCGSESLGGEGLIGPVMPVVGRTGSFTGQHCDPSTSVKEGYTALPFIQPPSLPAVTMASVSPDGKYLAIVTAGKGDVYVGSLSGQAASFSKTPRLTGGGVTSLSWDRNDDLWVAQNGDIEMLPATGKGAVPIAFNVQVSQLSVAPDGVRIAFIAQTAAGLNSGVYLAAIGGGAQISGQQGLAGTHLAIRSYAALGPNIAHPASLTWYDAEDLIVLNDAPTGNTLWDAPVDGQQAQVLQVQPQDVTSITADGAANVLVAGESGNSLAVSTSLEGPWYPLGEPGQNPAYPG
jgi:Lipoprotein LpqB beta-propeller domain/Sporulation and spore germination